MFAELRVCAYAARRTPQVEEAGKNRFVLLISTCLPIIGGIFITLIVSIRHVLAIQKQQLGLTQQRYLSPEISVVDRDTQRAIRV